MRVLPALPWIVPTVFFGQESIIDTSLNFPVFSSPLIPAPFFTMSIFFATLYPLLLNLQRMHTQFIFQGLRYFYS